jgi:hypothetical protein
MAAITDNAKVVYAPGTSTPNKADIVRLFGLIESILGSAVNGLLVGSAVVYQTRSALFANLARPDGSLGVVYGDSTSSYNGYYAKSGASGSGSWSLTSLALPSTFGADLAGVIGGLAALSSEVAVARAGSATLADRLNVILDAAFDQSDNVLNYLSGVISGQGGNIASVTDEVTAARQGSADLGARLSAILDWSNEQDAAQNEFLNGRIDQVSSSQESTEAEVNAARQGSPNLGARLAAILDWSNDQDAAQNEFFNGRVDEVILSLEEKTEPMDSR